MANPQLENGFVKIANEIMDALISHKLSGQELQTILFVIRKTYGFNKKEDIISLSQFKKALNISKVRASQIIKSLILRKILTVKENINGISRKLLFNKDFDEWITVKENINGIEKTKQTVNEKRNRPLIKNETTKDIITKNNITTNNIIKEKYLDFVMLSKEEHLKLIEKLGKNKTEMMITRLNDYLGSKGRKYKSHYFTILNWCNKDGIKKMPWDE